MTNITVYSQPRCMACTATYRKLNALGLAYDHVDVSQDPEALAFVQSLGHATAPVVVVAGGDHWSGYRPDRLEALVDVPPAA